MSSERKRISIYDYPEHLNPFSESHLKVPDKRKIFVDRLRKNGTWSSKISKRLNRSVSWIEKSWLAVDDSPRRTNENRICHDLHNNSLYTRQCQTHNATIRRESCSDVRQDAVETSQHMQMPNDELLQKNVAEENINKCDIKRRKKRPAPLPPNPSCPVEKEQPEEDNVAEVTDKICELEEISQDSISLEENEVTNAEISESHEKLVSEIPSLTDNTAPSAPSEPTLLRVNETELSEEIQNLRIERDDYSAEQSQPNEHEISQVESDKKFENVNEPVKPDENANILSIKNENEISSKVYENNIDAPCNGKAVVTSSNDG